MNATPSVPPAAGASRLGPKSPWPGLSSFDEADSAYFRGRDGEADELARLVRRERLTVLFGRSGLGKSSLLGAGLFPRLRQDQHLPVLLRIGYGAGPSPRAQIWQALERACTQAGIRADAPLADESLWAYFHRAGAEFWTARNRIVLPVLVFDQFEELFTIGQADEASRGAAAGFIDELAGLIEDRPSEALRAAMDADPALAGRFDFGRRGCKVVLSFREDFLAEVEALRLRMPSIMRNRYRLTPMNAAQARAVIASGAELVEPEQAPRILGLAWNNRAVAPTAAEAESLEIDPALLSVICSELNLRRQAAGAARIGAGLLTGAEREILGDFYERALQGLDPLVRVFIEDELITQAGYRDSHAYDDALHLPGLSRAAVDRLVDTRLLRVDDRFGVRRLELTHDVLTRVVRDSRDARKGREAEAAALQREQAAAAMQRRNRRHTAWVATAAVAALLLLGWAYRENGRAEEARAAATAAEQSAADAQAKALAKQLQLLDLQANAVALAASAAAAKSMAQQAGEQASQAAAAADLQTARAAVLQRDALATDLIVAARVTTPGQLGRQLLLGAEAVRRYPDRLDGQVEQLARLIGAHRVRRHVNLGAAITSSAASADSSRVIVATAANELLWLDGADAQVVARWKLQVEGIRHLSLSADGRVAMFVDGDQATVARLDPGRPPELRPLGAVTGGWFALSADGRQAATLLRRRVTIWDLDAAPGSAPRQAVELKAQPRPDCMRVDTAARQVTIGTFNANWVVDTDSGRFEQVALPAEVQARSRDCLSAVVRRPAASGQHYALIDRDGKETGPLRESSGDPWATALDSVQFDDTGQQLIAESAQGRHLWHVSGVPLPVARLERDQGSLQANALSGNRSWSALAFSNGDVLLMGQGGPRPFTARFRLQVPATALYFAADDKGLLALSESGVVQALRLAPRQRLGIRGDSFRAGEIEFNSAGTLLAAAGARPFQDIMALWGAQTGQLQFDDKRFSTLEFSPDGSRMVAKLRNSPQPRMMVFALDSLAAPLAEITLPEQASPASLAISSHSPQVAVGLAKGILLWDFKRPADDPQRLRRLDAVEPGRLSFHPSRPWLASAHGDGSVHIWHALEGRLLRRYPRPDDKEAPAATAAAFSPVGELLLTGGDDGAVAIYDLRQERLVAILRPPRDGAAEVTSLVFVQGGRVLAAGQLNGPKDLWDVDKRQWLGQVGAGEDVQAVAVSPKGRRLALKHADSTLSLHSWGEDELVRDACAIAGRNLSCTEWRQVFREQPYRKTCDALPLPEGTCTLRR